jgi:hypothetical protein
MPPEESHPPDVPGDPGDTEASGGLPDGEVGEAKDPAAITPLDIRGIFRETWAAFTAAWPACLVIYWGATASSWLIVTLLTLTLASFNALAADRQITIFLEFIRFVALVVVPAWLWIGQNYAYLKLARREPVAFDDLFRGGPWLLTTLLAMGIVLAIFAVPAAIFYFTAETLMQRYGGGSMVPLVHKISEGVITAPAAENEIAYIALSAVFLGSYLVFLAVMSRLGQYPFLILDRHHDVLEAHRTSLRWTRGRAGFIFLVFLIQFAINIAGALALYVGLFLTLPLTSLSSAVLYQAMSAREPAEPADDDDEEEE